jgi:hypothetical protein
MHALIFAHEPTDSAIVILVLVKANQVPEIPCRIGHCLIGVIERGLAELVPVPFQASHFAGLAADARGGVHQFADVVIAGYIASRSATAMS